MATIYILFGVSGCGKTTIGKMLAAHLALTFYDADDFHPQSNVAKMASGVPLQDADRWPWLDVLSKEIENWGSREGAVLACSALKEGYRRRLFMEDIAFAKAKKNFIYLNVSFEVIYKRLQHRKNHFFNPSLVQSQFDTLEVPDYGLHVDGAQTAEAVLKYILYKRSN